MERKGLKQIFLCLAMLLAFGSSQAVIIDNLYTVVIQVTDNTIATRNQQLPQVFDQVVKKVSSSQNIFHHPEYEVARQHLDRFISQYSYTENGSNNFTLTLRFNEQMIHNLLKKMGRATLGKNRPQILLWLVMQQGEKANFITQGPQELIAEKIDLLSKEYGLPIIFPLVDLTERLFISENDVLNFNLPPLQQAAERYNTSTMLLGKVSDVNGVWHCEWRLVDGSQNILWQAQNTNLNEELELMVNQLADRLIVNKTQMNMPKFDRSGITIRVKGVTSATDYAKILEHLKTLSAVKKVEIGSVDGSQAVFLITADGGMDAVVRSLKLSNVLFSETDNASALIGNNIDMVYRVGS